MADEGGVGEGMPQRAAGRGQLFVVSAPSGAGKSTLIRRLLGGEEPGAEGLAYSVSHTTRPPRPGERDGHEYHFVTSEAFETVVAGGGFLEWAWVHGHRYGTARAEVLPRLERGEDLILDIDVQGAEQVLSRLPFACGIFILPPSFAALAGRLAGRGLDEAAQIRRRLAVSRWEIERYANYQYVIINDDVRRAGRALAAIVLAERHRRERLARRVEEILGDFPNEVPGPPAG